MYVAALVLHPGHKWRYVDEKWADHTEWVEPVKASIKSFYEKYYQNRESAENDAPQEADGTQHHELDEFEAWTTPHD